MSPRPNNWYSVPGYTGVLSKHKHQRHAQKKPVVIKTATSNFDLLRAAELMKLSNYAYDQYNFFLINQVTPWKIPAPYINPVTVIYAGYEKISNAFPIVPGFEVPSPSSGPIPIGFIAESSVSNDIYIVFRGTGNGAEWKQDAKFVKVPCSFIPQAQQNDEFVHTGFYELYTTGTNDNTDSPQNVIKKYLTNLSIREQSQGKTYNVSSAGHSLGGALATLAICDIVLNTKYKTAKMYNFGSPRVGDLDFAKKFNSNTLFNGISGIPGSWRIANINDIVTMLPVELQGYVHVNGLFSITFGSKVEIDKPGNAAINHSHITYLITLVQLLKSAGKTAKQLKDNYFSADELIAAGYTNAQLIAAGYNII